MGLNENDRDRANLRCQWPHWRPDEHEATTCPRLEWMRPDYAATPELPGDPSCSSKALVAESRAHEGRTLHTEAGRVPSSTSPLYALVSVYLWIMFGLAVKSIPRIAFGPKKKKARTSGIPRAAEKRLSLDRHTSPGVVAPGQSGQKSAAPPARSLSASNAKRKKRLKRRKARIAAEKERAQMLLHHAMRCGNDAGRKISGEAASHAGKVEAIKQATSASKEDHGRRGGQIREERASGRDAREGMERSRDGCQRRVDAAREHIARLEKDLKIEQAKTQVEIEAKEDNEAVVASRSSNTSNNGSTSSSSGSGVELSSPPSSRKPPSPPSPAASVRETLKFFSGDEDGIEEPDTCPMDGFELPSPATAAAAAAKHVAPQVPPTTEELGGVEKGCQLAPLETAAVGAAAAKGGGPGGRRLAGDVFLYPPQLLEELTVRIAGRGQGEVTVDGFELPSPATGASAPTPAKRGNSKSRGATTGEVGRSEQGCQAPPGETAAAAAAANTANTTTTTTIEGGRSGTGLPGGNSRYPPHLLEELAGRIIGRGQGEVTVEGVGGGSGGGEEVEPQVTEKGFACVIPTLVPGDLRAMFLDNLRKAKEGGCFDGASAVRKAQTAIRPPEEELCQLELGEKLGDGSFGSVWAVSHKVLPGEFALKTIREGAHESMSYPAIVEMMVLARLSLAPHPNVVKAVAIDDRHVGIMPILLPMADGDFLSTLQSGGWTMSKKLTCVQQVASGAQHMHKHGIGHGDIKPENVLMVPCDGGGSVPQLADFGTARELGEGRPQMMGTLGYMPLEVMLGSVAALENQDVFALASMAFVAFAAPEKAQSNMFAHEDLYTREELHKSVTLQMQSGDVSGAVQEFEVSVTKRTMGDGSFEEMLKAHNLAEGLGSRESVSDCLLPFLQNNADDRPDVEVFQTAMGNFAKEAAEKEEEAGTQDSGAASSDTSGGFSGEYLDGCSRGSSDGSSGSGSELEDEHEAVRCYI